MSLVVLEMNKEKMQSYQRLEKLMSGICVNKRKTNSDQQNQTKIGNGYRTKCFKWQLQYVDRELLLALATQRVLVALSTLALPAWREEGRLALASDHQLLAVLHKHKRKLVDERRRALCHDEGTHAAASAGHR